MVKGSCACGETAYEFDASALQAKVACHCIPCRKTSGTPASYNLIVSSPSVHLTKGTLKQYVRKGDSGKSVTYNNCPTCFSCMWVDAEAMEGIKIVKMGNIDDEGFMDGLGMPQQEIFCRNMWGWEKGWEGSEKVKGAE